MLLKLLITDRIRGTPARSSRGAGGVPWPGQDGWYPRWGVPREPPLARSGWGVPSQVRAGDTPGGGTHLARSGWGVLRYLPSQVRTGGYPSQVRIGVPQVGGTQGTSWPGQDGGVPQV